jgi:hypothetical protein
MGYLDYYYNKTNKATFISAFFHGSRDAGPKLLAAVPGL